MRRVFHFGTYFLMHLLMVPLVALIYGYFVMLLWNWLMPEIFLLRALNYWQAWGLVVLSHLLFRGGRRGGRHSHGKHWHGRHDSRRSHTEPEVSSAT